MAPAETGYERRIGRYAASLAREFLRVTGVHRGERVLDVGCGPGALTLPLAEIVGVGSVWAIDPDADAVATCAGRVAGAHVSVAVAEELPFGDGEFDVVLAQLVVGLMADARRGVAEMRRVTRPGGRVATCVWDFGGGMTVLRAFWDAAAEVDPAASEHDQARTRPYNTREELVELFESAGLEDVTGDALTASAGYSGFADVWEPMLIPDGGPGVFLQTLPEAGRDEIRERLRRALGSPEGAFELEARAWYALGRAPR